MRLSRWLSAFLFISLLGGFSAQAQGRNSPVQIGRGAIQSVSWHPDGDYVFVSTVTGAWIYTPELQDIEHIPDIQLAALSPDGCFIAGVDDHLRVRLWDAATFEPIHSEDTSYRRIWSLAWSSDGRYLAVSGEGDESLTYVWDITNNWSGVVATQIAGEHLAWSPQSDLLAIHSSHGTYFVIFGMDPTVAISIPTGASNVIWQDESHILTVLFDERSEATRWDVSTGEEVGNFGISYSMPSYNHSGDLLAIGGGNHISLRDGETNESRTEITTDSDHYGFSLLAWSHNDQRLAAATYDFTRTTAAEIFLIDVESEAVVHRFTGTWQAIQQLAWSNDDRYLLAVDERQQMFVYDVASGETIAYDDAHTLVGNTMAWSSDSNQIAIADSIGGITIWNAQEMEQLRELPSNDFPITSIKWQPEGSLIAVQGRDLSAVNLTRPGLPLTTQVWDTGTGNSLNITSHLGLDQDATIDFSGWSPDGQQLAVLVGNMLYLWAVTTDQTQSFPMGEYFHVRDVVDLRWSPDGRYIDAIPATTSGCACLYLYDLESNQLLPGSTPIDYGVSAWSSDDQLISLRWGGVHSPRFVSPQLLHLTGTDLTTDVHNPPSRLLGLPRNIRQGFLSPTGKYAAAVDDVGNGMLWDATTGEPIAMLADTAQVVWSPDETQFVVQRLDGSVWLLESDGSIQEVLSTSDRQQAPTGSFFWSPDSRQLAYIHEGIVTLWQIER